jgi:hypothetical protein
MKVPHNNGIDAYGVAQAGPCSVMRCESLRRHARFGKLKEAAN